MPDAVSDVVTIGQSNGSREIIAITKNLDAAASALSSKPVTVDFSTLTARPGLSPRWGAVLGNIFASKFADTPMRVALPSNHTARIQLARAGVYFALSRNKHLDWTSLHSGNDRLVHRWTFDWLPAALQQPLFDLSAIIDDNAPSPAHFEPDLVAFLNPDRVELADGVEAQKAVIYPWLSGLVGRTASGASKLDLALQQDISLVIWELLGNVRDHARLRTRGLCSLSLFVTGGTHLSLSVIDTGRGMPATLPRLGFPDETSATEMVEAAFNGPLPRRERDRGRGLNRITQLIERLGGRLFAATGPHGDGAVVVDHRGGTGQPLIARYVSGLAMTGTVVQAQLPIPPRADSRKSSLASAQSEASGEDH